MTFQEALKDTAEAVNAHLGSLMPLEGAAAPRLVEAMRYASLDAGKRLRPFFVVETARLFGAGRHQALRAACALECVHCYSLVHDDLPAMDDDDLRRGRPTTHRAFDEATAILAGDTLLAFAFEILGDPETHPDAAIRVSLVTGLAQASGAAGMAGGQMLDLLAEAGGESGMDHIVKIQSLKTGALFRFACEAGAILGKAAPAERAALAAYAGRIGLAFQIADDVLDVESTAAALGKATQKDRAKGKATFADLLGLDGAKVKARALVAEAKSALAPFGAEAARLAEAADFILARRS
jgi:farnesyl diphosphate synthase